VRIHMGTNIIFMSTELNTQEATSRFDSDDPNCPRVFPSFLSDNMPSAVCHLANFTRERSLLPRDQYSHSIWTPLTAAYSAKSLAHGTRGGLGVVSMHGM
jgi:hypothetical protein